jgi:hypothetical protein
MKGFSRQAYIVTLDEMNLDRFAEFKLIPIVTDGAHFISIIKEHSVHENYTLPDFLYEYVYYMKKLVLKAHEELHSKYNCVKNPEIIYCAFYQDGAIHAYERMLALRNSGRYSCECEFLRTVVKYKKLIKEYRHRKQYEDVAYMEGYLYAHMLTLLFIKHEKEEWELPLFYAYGYKGEIMNFREYKKIFKEITNFHKSAYIRAQKSIKKLNKGGEFIMHHPAHL